MKICITCNKEKELSMFRIRKSSKDGYRNECKSCGNDRIKEYYKRHPWMYSLMNTKNRCRDHPRYNGQIRKINNNLTKEQIKEIWFRDKAWELKEPSIDRINNDGDYIYSNIRFIEKRENTSRGNL